MRIKGREWNRMRSRKAAGKEKEEQREDEMRSIVATDQLADSSIPSEQQHGMHECT